MSLPDQRIVILASSKSGMRRLAYDFLSLPLTRRVAIMRSLGALPDEAEYDDAECFQWVATEGLQDALREQVDA